MKHAAEESDEAKATDYLARDIIDTYLARPIGFIPDWVLFGRQKPRIRIKANSRPHDLNSEDAALK